MLSETPLYCHVDAQLLIYQYQSTTDCTRTSQLAMGSWVPLRWPPATHQLQSMRLTRGRHRPTACTRMPARHADDAVRRTASYLARRCAHPGSVAPPRPRLKTYTAATLLPSCDVPVAGAATGRCGGRLSAPRHGFPCRLGVSQLARGRSWPRLAATKAGRCFIPRPGWTVFHLPSTLGGWESLDCQPMVEIEQGRPQHKRDVDWTERSDAICSVVLPRRFAGLSAVSCELQSRTRLCSLLAAVILPLCFAVVRRRRAPESDNATK